MTARIIQTNSVPFERVEVDTVTVDILENALRNAREEMDAVLFRTAMSPGIREQGDCFPMIANRDGKMVVGQFGSFIHGFMEAYEGELVQCCCIPLAGLDRAGTHLQGRQAYGLGSHVRAYVR